MSTLTSPLTNTVTAVDILVGARTLIAEHSDRRATTHLTTIADYQADSRWGRDRDYTLAAPDLAEPASLVGHIIAERTDFTVLEDFRDDEYIDSSANRTILAGLGFTDAAIRVLTEIDRTQDSRGTWADASTVVSA